jgi:predicted nucleic acid-binding protein
MAKPTVYIETSVVSYLTARPSRNLIAYARQVMTRDWWDRRRADFDLVTSRLVVEEAALGDPEAAKDRLQVLSELDLLAIDARIEVIAADLLDARLLPTNAAADALHIAAASMHGVDYILTWNCRHIANMERFPRIAAHLQAMKLAAPVVCTPEELMGDALYPS